MNKFVITVAGALLSASSAAGHPAQAAQAAATGDEAAKLAEAHAIIAIMFPPGEREAMMDKIMTTITDQMRAPMPAYLSQDPALKKILDDFMSEIEAKERPLLFKHLPDMMEANAVAYTHEFSLAELKDIHAFAETPAGHHYFIRATALLADPAVAKVNKEVAAEARELPQSMLPELKDKIVAYVNAHPEVAAKLQAQMKDAH